MLYVSQFKVLDYNLLVTVLITCFHSLFSFQQVSNARNKVYLDANNLLLNLTVDATEKYALFTL